MPDEWDSLGTVATPAAPAADEWSKLGTVAERAAPAGYGLRADGTPKGQGFLGPLKRPDGSVSTEISIGVEFDGKETEIPTLVPTLSQKEIDHLLAGGDPTEPIVGKAVAHARERMAKGLSPFQQDDTTAPDADEWSSLGEVAATPAPARVEEQHRMSVYEAELNRFADKSSGFPSPTGPARGVSGDVITEFPRGVTPLEGAFGALESGVKSAQQIAPLIVGKELSRLKTGQGMDPPDYIKQQAIKDIYGESFKEHMAKLKGAKDSDRMTDTLHQAYQQRVHDLTQKRNAMLDIWSGVVADIEQEKGDIPKSEAQKELARARSQGDKWAVFKKYPLQTASTVVLESLPPSIAGAVLGAPGGPAGMAVGTGLGGAASEYANTLLSEASRNGYNISEPGQLAAFLDSPVEYGKASKKALLRSGIIATVDTATAATTGLLIGPAVRQGLKAMVAAGGKSVGIEMAGGFGGEFLAQAATKEKGEEFDLFDMAMEAVGEGVSAGPTGALSAAMELDRPAPATGVAGQRQAALVRARQAIAKGSPDADGNAPAPQIMQQAQEELKAALVELQSLPREAPAISAPKPSAGQPQVEPPVADTVVTADGSVRPATAGVGVQSDDVSLLEEPPVVYNDPNARPDFLSRTIKRSDYETEEEWQAAWDEMEALASDPNQFQNKTSPSMYGPWSGVLRVEPSNSPNPKFKYAVRWGEQTVGLGPTEEAAIKAAERTYWNFHKKPRQLGPGTTQGTTQPAGGDVGVQSDDVALLEEPASSVDWDAYYEDLVADLEAFAPARHSGRTDYEAQDAAQRFVDFARKDRSGRAPLELLREFAAQDGEVTRAQLARLRESVKNLPANPGPLKEEPTTGVSYDPKDERVRREDMDPTERADQPFIISQSNPWAKNAPDPVAAHHEANRVNRVAQPGANTLLGSILRHYPNLRGMKGTSTEVLDAFHAHIVDNLLWLYHTMPPSMRGRAQEWYRGANKLTRGWSKKYGQPRQAVAAVIASLSPGTDWHINVDMARRVLEFVRDGQRRTVDDKMLEWVAGQVAAKPKSAKEAMWQSRMREWRKKGVRYSQLPVEHRALFLRAWDESHNSTDFPIVNPDGSIGEWQTTDSGARAMLRWQSLANVKKALSILDKPTKASISMNLGEGHKVRSFYNNILSPANASSVTIDTHAVAAALLRPLGIDSLEVNHNFGGTKEGSGYRGSGAYGETGGTGTYGLIADAYRDAARQLGILPRELQSAVWEAANRWMFPPGYKNSNQADLIEDAWLRYKKGEIDLTQVRHELLRLTIEDRLGPGAGAQAIARAERFERLSLRRGAGQAGRSANAARVSGPDPHGRRAGSVSGGTKGTAATTLAEQVRRDEREQTGGQDPKAFHEARRKAKADVGVLGQLHFDFISGGSGARLQRRGDTVSGALRIFVNGLKEDLNTPEGVDVSGHWASTPSEVALLAQVFRNPKFETVHYLFTKDGKVVGRYAATTRVPHYAAIFAKGDTEKNVLEVGKGLGADGFWVVHNHPSGDPSPSDSDVRVTRRLYNTMPGMRGHIIINHGKYTLINAQGDQGQFPILGTTGPDPFRKTKEELGAFAGMIGQTIHGPSAVAQLHKQMSEHVREGTVTIILTDGRSMTKALGDISVEDFMNEQLVTEQIRKAGAEVGAAYAFAYYEGTNPGVHGKALVYTRGDGVFTDVILATNPEGLRGRGPNSDMWLGIGNLSERAARVAEVPGDVRIAAAKAEVKEAWSAFYKLGIYPDPKEDARKVHNFYKAVFKLARLYVAKGIRTATEFAKSAGIELNDIVQTAWDDAVAGIMKASPSDLKTEDVAGMADELRVRKFSARFGADPRMAPELRAKTGNRTYLPIGNEVTVVEATAIIEQHGIDAAISMMKDEQNRDISDRERVALGQAIVTKLNAEYARTKNEAVLDKAVDTAEWLTEYGTRLGQGVQAFAIWSSLTPDGFVRAYVKTVNKSNSNAARRRWTRPRAPATADRETQKRIHNMATEALRKPAGFQRDEALVDVLAVIAKAKGVSKLDLAIAFWYANLLSGWTTQVRNTAGNIANLFAETGAHAVVRPQSIPAMIAGIFNGAARGAFDASTIVRTGKVTGTRVGKVEAPRSLELIDFKGPFYLLNAWKYVFRVMAATDMVFFRTAEEMRARFIGREIARTEGLKGDAYSARVAALLHNTSADQQRAEEQARIEGLSGNTARRRAGELMEQGRPAALVDDAANYGRFATFNQPPAGVLGVIANGIREMSGKFPPLRLVVPFTNIVANVTNTALNFTPWGYRRLFPSVFLEQNWMSDTATPLDYQLQAARATLGTLGLVALYAMAELYDDDEDPAFAITANGPQDPGQRRQLMETGWKPYTLKIGQHYISYRETPLHLGLAYLGTLLDAHRYKHLGEQDALSRAAYGIQQIGTALLSQSFLKSLGEFFESLAKDQVPRTGPKFAGLGRTASGIVVPNLVKQIDKLFDPTVYDSSTIQGAFIRDVPVARRSLKPAINILGDTIQTDQNPFHSATKPDELWTTLARKQAWISVPSRTTMVGERLITPEEYYDLIASSGPEIRWRLEVLLPAIDMADPERAQEMVDKVVQQERQRAKLREGIGGR